MFDILQQTDDFIVVHKPAGASVHKDQQTSGFVMQLCEFLGIEQLYPVHRLDKVTSGLMVLAKHSAAAAELSEQFRLRKVTKYYLALSDKKPRRKQGAIVGDMEKARRGSWKLLKSKCNPAVTQFFSSSVKPGIRLFLLKPTTGKTHQLRVAMKSEGAPILGDPLYASSEADRAYLHAYYLSFSYQDKRYNFSCMPTISRYFDEKCIALIKQNYERPDELQWPKLSFVK